MTVMASKENPLLRVVAPTPPVVFPFGGTASLVSAASGLFRPRPITPFSRSRMTALPTRPIERLVLYRTMQRFLALETAGGLLLILFAVAALVWANSPWSGAYEALFNTYLAVGFGDFQIKHSLLHWINDGLMALFFFVVGPGDQARGARGRARQPAQGRPRPRRGARRHGRPGAVLRRSSPRAPKEPRGGASPWPPTSPSRSAC